MMLSLSFTLAPNQAIYWVFMTFVQLILMNLLVAMMAGTFARFRTNAQLMAECERAKLVLLLEHPSSTKGPPSHRGGTWAYTAEAAQAALAHQHVVPTPPTRPLPFTCPLPSHPVSPPSPAPSLRVAQRTTVRGGQGLSHLSGLSAGLDGAQGRRGFGVRWNQVARLWRRPPDEVLYPRWLHVLMPSTEGEETGGVSAEEKSAEDKSAEGKSAEEQGKERDERLHR